MKKIITAVIIIAVLGVGYWLISPLFLSKQVKEALPTSQIPVTTSKPSSTAQLVATGSFRDVLAGHHAKGTVNLLKVGSDYYVRFEDDFKITNGPDLVVYLGKNNQYDPATKLSVLKGNIGSQNYQIPATIDVSQYDEVWVWCRSFSVPFGAASLNRKL